MSTCRFLINPKGVGRLDRRGISELANGPLTSWVWGAAPMINRASAHKFLGRLHSQASEATCEAAASTTSL